MFNLFMILNVYGITLQLMKTNSKIQIMRLTSFDSGASIYETYKKLNRRLTIVQFQQI